MRYINQNIATFLTLAFSAPLAAQTAANSENSNDGVFTLGQITVTAPRDHDQLNDSLITSEQMWRFNTGTLDNAVRLVPGVSSTLDTNGRRNEHDILVRGFGRWQVPLSIDGVRVYLPADNRLDFRRFLTDDIAQVQISKGYASVLDGPGGMGGAINLVTSKPTKAFETRFQSGANFGEDASCDGWNAYGMVGTKQDGWYAQASGNFNNTEHWRLSDDFQPPSAIEDGGDRNRSFTRDGRLNAKIGLTPNETDEYSFNLTRQVGRKGAPLNVNNATPNPPNSYWDWPDWNITNYYFLSNTQLGDKSYLRAKLFYNDFYNSLFAYDNATYTTKALNGRFESFYDDNGRGANIEAGTSFIDRSVTKLAFSYRQDEHSEYNINRPDAPQKSVEPKQWTKENTWSVALENTYSATDAIDLVAGVSYNKNELKLAQDVVSATNTLFNYPTGGSDSVDAQAAVFWERFKFSISSRSRFPTIFERFSTRFGTARPNPDLKSERATNYEVAWNPATWLHAAVFYSELKDMIQTVIVVPNPQTTQAQNVGDGHYFGAETSVDWRLTDSFRVGGNYSWLQRKITDSLQPTLKVVGTPSNYGMAYVEWTPIPQISVTPSVEFASNRWSEINVTGLTGYTRTGQYTLANLQVDYQATGNVRASLGGRNLLDKNYELADGFPEPGRTMYAKFRVDF